MSKETPTPPAPGQVWRGKHGAREVLPYWFWGYRPQRIAWGRPDANEWHRTMLKQWHKWSATATLVSEQQ